MGLENVILKLQLISENHHAWQKKDYPGNVIFSLGKGLPVNKNYFYIVSRHSHLTRGFIVAGDRMPGASHKYFPTLPNLHRSIRTFVKW